MFKTDIQELQVLESDGTINHHKITTIKKLFGIKVFTRVHIKQIDTTEYIIPKNPTVIGFNLSRIKLDDEYSDDNLAI